MSPLALVGAMRWCRLADAVAVVTWAATATAQGQQQFIGLVTRVVDGDTIYVAIGNQIESVRYIGINAPELHHPTRGEEPGGAAATVCDDDAPMRPSAVPR